MNPSRVQNYLYRARRRRAGQVVARSDDNGRNLACQPICQSVLEKNLSCRGCMSEIGHSSTDAYELDDLAHAGSRAGCASGAGGSWDDEERRMRAARALAGRRRAGARPCRFLNSDGSVSARPVSPCERCSMWRFSASAIRWPSRERRQCISWVRRFRRSRANAHGAFQGDRAFVRRRFLSDLPPRARLRLGGCPTP